MRWAGLIFLVPVLVFGQSPASQNSFEHTRQLLASFVSTETSNDFSTAEFERYLLKLSDRRSSSKSDAQFLETVFYKTHRQWLKHFNEQSGFAALLNTGDYNCLTATALYASILDYFQVKYKIIETNYHIFLLINSSDGDVLLETTDPAAGYIKNPSKIQAKINEYSRNSIPKDDTDKYFKFQTQLYNEVNLDQLVGLLYYNLAVQAYNSGKNSLAIEHLERASNYYYSNRTKELTRLLLLRLMRQAPDRDLNTLARRVKSINDKGTQAAAVTTKSF
jgi:hypothetical protein